MMNDVQAVSLSECLARGPLSGQEVMRYAFALAEAMRRLHDQGTVIGTLEPSRVILTGSGVNVILGETAADVTPYTSPEQLQGFPADSRSDIFAFGAIVYEMLTGHKAFEGSTTEELRTVILEREPVPLPSGNAELARVAAKCLAKPPLQRFQRVQRVQMELKMLTVFARRAEQEAAPKADRIQVLLSTGLAELEGRLAARLAAQDTVAAELRSKVAEQAEKLRDAAVFERKLLSEIEDLVSRLVTRLDAGDTHRMELEKQAAEHKTGVAAEFAALAGRLDAAEIRRTEMEKESAALVAGLTGANEVLQTLSNRLDRTEQTLRAHSSSIESLESAIGQTDDLVERVVEAFDSLEKSFVEQHEAMTASVGN